MSVDDEPIVNPENHSADNGDPRPLPKVDGIKPSLIRRVIGHLTDETEEATESRQKAYRQCNMALLQYIASLIGMQLVERSGRAKKNEKKNLFEAILEKVTSKHPASSIIMSSQLKID